MQYNVANPWWSRAATKVILCFWLVRIKKRVALADHAARPLPHLVKERFYLRLTRLWPASWRGRLLVLGGLGFIGIFLVVLIQQRWLAKKSLLYHRPALEFIRPLLDFELKDIRTFQVQDHQQRIKLVHSEDGWQLEQPINARANSLTVMSLLFQLGTWLPRGKITQPNSKALDPYGFTAQSVVYILTTQQSSQLAMRTGASAPQGRGIYAQRLDENEVFILPRLDLPPLAEWSVWLRERRLLADLDSPLRAVTLREQDRVIALEKISVGKKKYRPESYSKSAGTPSDASKLHQDIEPWFIKVPVYAPADQLLVENLLTLLKQWEFSTVVEETAYGKLSLAQYGLSQPYATLIVEGEKERLPWEFIFSLPKEGGEDLFAKSNRDSKIVRIVLAEFNHIRALIYQIHALKLVLFLDQIQTIDFLATPWLFKIRRDGHTWQVSKSPAIDQPDENKKNPMAIAPAAAAKFITTLMDLTYFDVLLPEHPAYRCYPSAELLYEISFMDQQDVLKEMFSVSQHPDISEALFLKRHSDGVIFLIAPDSFSDLFNL